MPNPRICILCSLCRKKTLIIGLTVYSLLYIYFPQISCSQYSLYYFKFLIRHLRIRNKEKISFSVILSVDSTNCFT